MDEMPRLHFGHTKDRSHGDKEELIESSTVTGISTVMKSSFSLGKDGVLDGNRVRKSRQYTYKEMLVRPQNP